MDELTHVQSVVTFAWWMVLAMSVLLYIVLDGADLGAGVFSLFVRNPHAAPFLHPADLSIARRPGPRSVHR